jgi:hypothetical protein
MGSVTRKPAAVLAILAIAVTASACGGTPAREGSGPTSTTPAPIVSATSPPNGTMPTTERKPIEIPPANGAYRVRVDPEDFGRSVDNPYFPLEPGTTYVFEGTSGGQGEVDTVTVTHRTKEILGVACIVVRDEVSVGGALQELTFDWYAQDVDGNVWYFGEDSREYANGVVTGTGGSWEAGVNGALPGIIMLAEPKIGTAYRQEFSRGAAEDKGKVVALGQRVSVPAGSFGDVVVTEDFTPLEPSILERKYYAPGIGVVLERLITGGDEVSRLVEVHRPA